MKIELKSIKIVDALSEETICFTAKVYVNGKHAGEANNRGHGGCSDCHFNSREIREEVEAYVATLPLEKWEYEGKEYSRKLTIDDVIDQIVETHQNEKSEKRIVKVAEKKKKMFAERGYPFTLELRLHHEIRWTAVKTLEAVQTGKERFAKENSVSVDKIKLL